MKFTSLSFFALACASAVLAAPLQQISARDLGFVLATVTAASTPITPCFDLANTACQPTNIFTENNIVLVECVFPGTFAVVVDQDKNMSGFVRASDLKPVNAGENFSSCTDTTL